MQASLLCDFKDSSSFDTFIGILKSNIKTGFGEEAFDSIFKDVQFKSYDGTNLLLSVASDKIKNAIFLHYQNRFEKILKKTFSKFFNETLASYDFIVNAEKKEDSLNLNDKIETNTTSIFNIAIKLEKKYTFLNFLEEEENKLVSQMAKHFANLILSKEEGLLEFSKQLFVCGGIGNGKTHLAQAVAASVMQNSSEKVIYTTAEKFMFNFQTAVKNNAGVEFTREFLGVKLLIIDDLHLVATKKKTIAEIQRISYSILSEGGFVVFCSSGTPNVLPIESESVKQFFNSSYVLKIKEPTEEFRFKILKAKTSCSKYKISDATLRLLASKIQTNIRELEGAMGRMVLHSQILNSEAEQDVVSFITTDIFPHKELKRHLVQDIQEKISLKLGLTTDEIKSNRRTKKIALARQIAIFITSKLTTLSYVEIGKSFGGRKHSTVIHSIKVIERLSLESRNFKDEVEALKFYIEDN